VPGVGQATGNKRYVTLDAMRGIAAIAVVMRHFGQTFHGWEPDSYLAVDLFFVLSGFVLSLSYDRLFRSGMNPMTFMRLRLVRLLPLSMVGAALGLASQIIASPTNLTPPQSILSTLLTAISVPTPPLASSRILFPFNTAFWSLFFELWVANVLFAMFWRWIKGPILGLVIFVSAVGLLFWQRQTHVMDVGWGWDTVLGGFPRVIFSFFAGVAIRRMGADRLYQPQIPSSICICMLAFILIAPISGVAGNFIRLLYILILFPCLVYLGAGANDSRTGIGTFLGDVSYGVYTIHFPLIIILAWATRVPTTSTGPIDPFKFFTLECGFLACIVVLASVLDAKFDRPVRRALMSLMTRGQT